MNKKTCLIISAILTVLVSAVLFGLWPDRDFVFWTVYLFSIVAIWIVGVNAACLELENKFFAANLTTLTTAIVYLIANVIWSIISMIFLTVSGRACLVGHIVLLGLFTIVWMLAKAAIRYINSQDK